MHPLHGTWIANLSKSTRHANDQFQEKDGVALGRGTYEVDEAGKMLTATVAGVDASGKPFGQVIVFDRAE